MTDTATLNKELAILLNKSATPIRQGLFNMTDYDSLLRIKDIKRMLQLVKLGADVNTVSVRDGSTLLMRVAEFGSKQFMSQVLSYNPNIHHQNAEGQTALHRAALFNRSKAVEMLLSVGASPIAIDHNAMSPLELAFSAIKNHDATIELLLKARQNAIQHQRLYPSHVDEVYEAEKAYSPNVKTALLDRYIRLQKYGSDQRALQVRSQMFVQKYNRPGSVRERA